MNSTAILVGIAVGAALGIGIALSRRKKSRWDSAREMSRRITDRSGELTDVTRDIVDRVRALTGGSLLLAAGGLIRRAGQVIVGDKGPELLTAPRGARVDPLPDRRREYEDRPIIVQSILDGKLIAESIARRTADQTARR